MSRRTRAGRARLADKIYDGIRTANPNRTDTTLISYYLNEIIDGVPPFCRTNVDKDQLRALFNLALDDRWPEEEKIK